MDNEFFCFSSILLHIETFQKNEELFVLKTYSLKNIHYEDT